MKCKVWITDCTDPYKNLAAEEMLMGYVKPGEVLLYLWQNENTVVIGRNQNAWRECRLERFTAQKGKLARRLSGGGAVYHDMGNQNFTFFAHSNAYDVSKQSAVICHAVNQFGIKAGFNGRNDILVDDRKFSGNAYYSNGTVQYHHGTILLSSDMAKLGEFLSPSKTKLAAKGVKSVRSRVINLCEIAPDLTAERMRQALITSMKEIYGCEAEQIDDSVLDKEEWEKLTKHYGSRQWTIGRLSDFNQQFQKRLSFGEMELQLFVKDGVIKDAVLYSDVLNAEWVEAVNKALLGNRFTIISVEKALSNLNIEKDYTEELLKYLCSVMS